MTKNNFIILIFMMTSCEVNTKRTTTQSMTLAIKDTMKYYLFMPNNDSFEIIECPIDIETKTDFDLNQNFKASYDDLKVNILNGYYNKGEPVGEWLYKYIKNDSLLYKEVYWVNHKNELLSFIAPMYFEHVNSSDTFIEFQTPDKAEKFDIQLIDSIKISETSEAFDKKSLIRAIQFVNQNPVGYLNSYHNVNKFRYTVCFTSKPIKGKIALLNYYSNNDLPLINVVLMEMIRNLKIDNKKVLYYINNKLKVEYTN